jgi:putative inorganic carbon (hco3(-)) transporter
VIPRSSPGNSLKLVAWIGVLLAAIYLETSGGTYPGIASVTGQIATQVLAYVLLGGWLLVAALRPSWRPSTPLLAPVALVSATYSLSALASQRPRLSLEPTLAGLGFALTYLFLSRLLADPWFRRRIESLLIVSVALVAFGYIAQVTSEWIVWWGLIGRIALPPLRPSSASLVFGSPNLIAAYLILLAPLGVVVLAQRTHRTWLAAIVCVAAGIAVFLTGSRGGYLGVATGFGLGILLAIARSDVGQLSAMMLGRIRARPILLVPIGVALAGLALFVPAVLYRFAQGGESLRLDLWRSALTIFADHPVLGGGPGTWVQLKVAANPPSVANIIVPHAHDMYVQAAAELGLAGLAAAAILLVTVARRLKQGIQSRLAGLPIQTAAVAVGLAAFAGQSLVDNLVNLPLICLPVIGLVAWIDGRLTMTESKAAPARGKRLGALGPVVVLIALLLAATSFARIDSAGLDDMVANDAAVAGDWPAALGGYERALASDPELTLYQLQRSSALARVGRTGDARMQLSHAVEADPVAINLVSLATLDIAAGDGAAALSHIHRAVELGWFDPTVALNAGIIGEQTGDRSFAVDQFANAVAWDPPIASSAFWDEPARQIAKADVISKARTRVDPATAALILAYSGDAAGAHAELNRMPESKPRDLDLAASAWLAGDVAAAQPKVAAILDRDPRDWAAAGWMSRIARLSGDTELAERYERWASIVEFDAASSLSDELSVVPAPPGDATAGLPANYPWSVYLRPIAPYLLAPQVVRIGTR